MEIVIHQKLGPIITRMRTIRIHIHIETSPFLEEAAMNVDAAVPGGRSRAAAVAVWREAQGRRSGAGPAPLLADQAAGAVTAAVVRNTD
ncbi:MAG TPA: hypothetical protein PKV56_03235 [Burkholderiaceae bacterium]|nr:hypothetical protein [Burkholderiaceae bacterium]